jgi:hypothetical protein
MSQDPSPEPEPEPDPGPDPAVAAPASSASLNAGGPGLSATSAAMVGTFAGTFRSAGARTATRVVAGVADRADLVAALAGAGAGARGFGRAGGVGFGSLTSVTSIGGASAGLGGVLQRPSRATSTNRCTARLAATPATRRVRRRVGRPVVSPICRGRSMKSQFIADDGPILE